MQLRMDKFGTPTLPTSARVDFFESQYQRIPKNKIIFCLIYVTFNKILGKIIPQREE